MRQSTSQVNRQYDERLISFNQPVNKFDHPSMIMPNTAKGAKGNWYPSKLLCDKFNESWFIKALMEQSETEDGQPMFTKKQIAEDFGDLAVQLNLNMNKELSNGSRIFSMSYVLYPRQGGVFHDPTKDEVTSTTAETTKVKDKSVAPF